MKKTTTIISMPIIASTFLFSCTSGENIQSKMERYSPRIGEKNIIPEIPVAKFNFTNTKRGPASTTTNSSDKDNLYSNKKLYFLTLVDEYENLKKFSKSFDAPKISICPNFHTGLLNHYEKFSYEPKRKNLTYANYDVTKLNSPEYVTAHPELYLSLSKDSTTPKVLDIITKNNNISSTQINEYVANAIDIHLSKTYFELKELCEYGSSDNYYIYENLITHTKNTNFGASEENMKILLKTTLFSNLAIINSLNKNENATGRSIASANENGSVYTKELISKLNVNWTLDYFKNLKH